MREPAPAKINLSLHVTGRRDDGYHLLDTLVAFTAHGDTLSLVAHPGAAALRIDGPFAGNLEANADNLVLKAARLLADHLKTRHGSPAAMPGLSLHKALPIASGLGGGSADAAACLRLLRRHWSAEVSLEALAALSLPLGADVPMCVLGRPMRVRGIGEDMQSAALPALDLVLVNPGVATSTPAVFRALQQRHNPPMPTLPHGLDATGLAAWLSTGTRNDLEEPALRVTPAIADVLAVLRGAPESLLARMSGSGATCFALCRDPQSAARLAHDIRQRHPDWWVVPTRTTDGPSL